MSLPKPPSPFALFLDVDGTIIDLAPRPDAVVVPPNLKQTLAALTAQLGGALALVSGRTIADLDALFRPLQCRASGVHGAELRFDPDGPIASMPEALLPKPVLDGLRALADRFPGTLVEDKRYSAAMHYRAVPDARDALKERVEQLIAGTDDADLRILPGHMVFEIKRAGCDKGVAIVRLLEREPFKGRVPVFIGDDVTDEPAFATVAARGGVAVAVGVARPGASALLGSPGDVRHWLATLVDGAPRR